MSDDAKKVYDMLMALPVEERLTVLDTVCDAEVIVEDEEVSKVIQERLTEYCQGLRPSLDGEEVFALLRKKSHASVSN